jgi:hypothetical protein
LDGFSFGSISGFSILIKLFDNLELEVKLLTIGTNKIVIEIKTKSKYHFLYLISKTPLLIHLSENYKDEEIKKFPFIIPILIWYVKI